MKQFFAALAIILAVAFTAPDFIVHDAVAKKSKAQKKADKKAKKQAKKAARKAKYCAKDKNQSKKKCGGSGSGGSGGDDITPGDTTTDGDTITTGAIPKGGIILDNGYEKFTWIPPQDGTFSAAKAGLNPRIKVTDCNGNAVAYKIGTDEAGNKTISVPKYADSFSGTPQVETMALKLSQKQLTFDLFAPEFTPWGFEYKNCPPKPPGVMAGQSCPTHVLNAAKSAYINNTDPVCMAQFTFTDKTPYEQWQMMQALQQQMQSYCYGPLSQTAANQQQCQSSQNQLASYQQVISGIPDWQQLVDAAASLNTWQTELATLTQQYPQLQSQVSNLESALASGNYQQYQDAVNQAQSAVTAAENQITQVQSQITQVQSQITQDQGYMTAITTIQNNLTAAEAARANAATIVGNTQSTINTAQQQLPSLQAAVQTAAEKKRYAELFQIRFSLNGAQQTEWNTLRAKYPDLATMFGNLPNWDAVLAESNLLAQDHTTAIQAVTNKQNIISTAQARLPQEQNTLTEKTNAKNAVQAQLDQQLSAAGVTSLPSLNDRITQKQGDLAQKQSDMAQKQSALAGLQSQVTGAQTAAATYETYQGQLVSAQAGLMANEMQKQLLEMKIQFAASTPTAAQQAEMQSLEANVTNLSTTLQTYKTAQAGVTNSQQQVSAYQQQMSQKEAEAQMAALFALTANNNYLSGYYNNEATIDARIQELSAQYPAIATQLQEAKVCNGSYCQFNPYISSPTGMMANLLQQYPGFQAQLNATKQCVGNYCGAIQSKVVTLVSNTNQAFTTAQVNLMSAQNALTQYQQQLSTAAPQLNQLMEQMSSPQVICQSPATLNSVGLCSCPSGYIAAYNGNVGGCMPRPSNDSTNF